MEGNMAGSSITNGINQPDVDKWESDRNGTSYSYDTNEQNIEQLNDMTINDDVVTENYGAENQDGENAQNPWVNQFQPKSYQGNNSGYQKRRGGFNKSNYSNNSFENSTDFDTASTNFQNNGRSVRERGAGRSNYVQRSSDENESFGGGYPNYNNRSGNTTRGHRGQGRGYHRGRGGRPFGGHGNYEDGYNKENDKFAGPPKPQYIPPENEESFSGIEAGLNFDKYQNIEVKVSGSDTPKLMTSFHTSGLRDILIENLSACNFSTPTPIQNYAIPLVVAGKDLMASAQTGSGKTAAYALPILHHLLSQPTRLIFDENHCEPQAVIMAPTRELVIQIRDSIAMFCKGTTIKNELLYGGTSTLHQKSQVLRGVHILTATPGRLNDFVDRGVVTFSSVKFFVLDEADRMLDMGFKPDIERVLTHPTMTPNDLRQTLMFSATFPSEIQHMAASYLKPDYTFVAVGEVGGACKDVVQTVMKVPKFKKKEALHNLLKEMENCQGTIVFVEQKRYADYIAAYLSEMDYRTTSIHGDREQPERELALRDFRTKKMKILVATAVAARGLDISNVTNVVNLDLPKTIDEYVHRIGRTGRLGNAGRAFSFFDPENDIPLASELIRILRQAEQDVPSWLEDIANGVQATPDINSFIDIRTNMEVSSASVPAYEGEEEEEW